MIEFINFVIDGVAANTSLVVLLLWAFGCPFEMALMAFLLIKLAGIHPDKEPIPSDKD